MLIEKDKSLQQYNTFGIDVKSKLFAAFQTIEDLQQLLSNEDVLKEKKTNSWWRQQYVANDKLRWNRA